MFYGYGLSIYIGLWVEAISPLTQLSCLWMICFLVLVVTLERLRGCNMVGQN